MVRASLVWDGGATVTIPHRMGNPLPDQMRGTVGEQLVEVGTRLCYDSLGLDAAGERKGRATEDTLGNVMEQYHGCYDAETDVLTADGWKAWPDVTKDDHLATRTATGKLEYHKPIRLIAYQHFGRMYRVEARGVDLLVTPDHKMLACLTTTREGRRKADASYELIEAKVLGHRSHAYVKTAVWERAGESTPLAVMSLLGFAVGDGHVAEDGKEARFHLRRQRKIGWLREACGALAGLGITFHEYAHDLYVVKFGKCAQKWLDLFRSIYDENREKQIPQGLLTACDIYELRALFDGLMASDGHEGRTGDSYDTTSAKLAGQVQQLALHIGLAANVCYVDEERASSYGDKPLIRLSIISRELRPEVNKFIDGVGRTSWVEDWEGDVYCAEVPNNTLYVRRNGKPVWSGNSVLEHYVRTFFIADDHPAVDMQQGEGLAYDLMFQNRLGCFVRKGAHGVRVTMNLRAVVEWHFWSDILINEHHPEMHDVCRAVWTAIGDRIQEMWRAEVPLLMGAPKFDPKGRDNLSAWALALHTMFVEPETDAEKHVSLYLVGSRGFSHEMVRHRFAMSQRSTRYCEEGDNRWHWHPLIKQFISEVEGSDLGNLLSEAEASAKAAYGLICNELQDWLAAKLPKDTPYKKKHARKQARGAARGFQGNAMETQMLYTAPVWGWRHIINMRAADAADAEIREVISEAVPVLQVCRYGDRFADMVLVPASDGMGMALRGGGHK